MSSPVGFFFLFFEQIKSEVGAVVAMLMHRVLSVDPLCRVRVLLSHSRLVEVIYSVI